MNKRKSKRRKPKQKKNQKKKGGKINILFVPGVSGVWRKNDPKYPFHKQLWRILKKTMNIYAPYNHNIESTKRQNRIKQSIISNNCHIALGYSEGGCRLLKCFEENKFKNLNTLILVSPSFSTNDLDILDISKAIDNLKNTRVILIETDNGYGGSDSQYQWSERIKLKESIKDNIFAEGSEIIFLKDADHMITNPDIAQIATQNILSRLF